jgi:anti-sigma factor (TIGR02949 family)
VTPKQEKVVGGLSCGQVLDRLSDYLDGDLEPAAREAVEAHLRGCDGCARFGGELKGTIQALRRHLGASPAVPPRLRQRLLEALGGGREPGSSA